MSVTGFMAGWLMCWTVITNLAWGGSEPWSMQNEGLFSHFFYSTFAQTCYAISVNVCKKRGGEKGERKIMELLGDRYFRY